MNVAALSRTAWVALLGAVFAVSLYHVWSLEGRWFVVTLAGVILVAVSMIFAGRLSDIMLVVLLFSVPLAGFAKWSFLDEDYYSEDVRNAALYSGTLGLGILDFVVVGMYLAWAFKIFVAREEPFPQLHKTDTWVALVLASYAFSLWGAQFLQLGFYAIQHAIKHALVYFYVSRHFRREDVPWFVASVAVAIVVESAIGVLQYADIVPPGLILDKGAGSERLSEQYRVPGIEDAFRATGLTYDSHSLGVYLAMLMPTILVFANYRALSRRLRLWGLPIMGLGLAALVVTYSRSAWIAGAMSLGIIVFALLAWRERYVIPAMVWAAIALVVSAPWVFGQLLKRLIDAPPELLQVRFDQFPIAWSIWRDHFLFGAGAGNYMERMFQYNVNWSLPEPVHLVPLFIGAELGLFGIVAFYGMVLAVYWRLWQCLRRGDDTVRRLALAVLAGLSAYIFDGMSSPLFREPTVYMMFWIIVAISAAPVMGARVAGASRVG